MGAGMNEVNVQYALGSINSRLRAGEQDRKDIKETLAAQDAKLDTIVRYLERQKGGRRTLMAMGSALAATCGTLAGFAVTWWTSKHG